MAVTEVCSRSSNRKPKTNVSQQVSIRRNKCVIDHPLHEQRAGHCEHFDRKGQHEDLAKGTLEPHHPPYQGPQPDPRHRLSRLEPSSGRELQGHASEVLGHLGQGQATHAGRRIVDDDAAAAGTLQHDEMIQIPMQYAWGLEQPELF